MYKKFTIALFLFTFWLSGIAQNIPTGDIKGPFLWKSKIYAGTERNYWIYVPKQYDSAKPACLMVLQDGLNRANSWKLSSVLDTLISEKSIPVQIGIFIEPGIVRASDTTAHSRFNRSFEYDALGDRYARFLLEEIIPEVSRSYNLSTNPNDRCIGGSSSGAICAFNVAWERPDAFRRVFSSIGTYVGLRGAHEFATLIRKTEAKPLRIFLQDGTKDNNSYAGDWYMANQNMLSAFTWAGYEVNHAWGEGGGHDSRHTITIIADALRWLWKDYPTPIQIHTDSIVRFNPTTKNDPWKEIPSKMKIEKLAVNNTGELFFTSNQSIYKIDERGGTTLFTSLKGKTGAISFHNNGKLYVSDLNQHKIISIDKNATVHDEVLNVNADFMTISNKGIYFTETIKNRIGFYSFSNKQIGYLTAEGSPTGLAITAEQTFLNVGMADKTFGYSYKIKEDGNLELGQEFIHYHIPYGNSTPGTQGMAVDTASYLYSATTMGVQVSEQLGKVNFIFSKPAQGAMDVKLGGSDFNTLYVNCNGRLFARKIKTKGVLSWMPVVKPARPRM